LGTGAKSPEGKARQTAGRLAYYAARRAAGLPVLPRKLKDAPRATPKAPRSQPKPTVLSEADIAFAKRVGMKLAK
jgi:hypothetical protein